MSMNFRNMLLGVSLLWCLTECCCLAQAQTSKFNTATQEAPFVLICWPTNILVHEGEPINVYIAVCNQTPDFRYIRLNLAAAPPGNPQPELFAMMMECTDSTTKIDMPFFGPPPSLPVALSKGYEPADQFGPGILVGRMYNLLEYFHLTPGSYELQMQYDTSYVPAGFRVDKRAWHGATNIVQANITVLPPAGTVPDNK